MKPRRPLPTAATAARSVELIVIGCSAGGFDALQEIFPALGANFPLPIVVVIHLSPDRHSLVPEAFGRRSQLVVKEAEEKELIEAGKIYFAPPGYHLLVEADKSLSLSVEEPVHYSRPSIDVLFESAAAAFRENALGIVLSGANSDGAEGLKAILDAGGYGIVENPRTARYSTMPEAALELAKPQGVMSAPEIGAWLAKMEGQKPKRNLETR